MASKFTAEEIQEIAEIFGVILNATVEPAVHTAFNNYREKYFVEPESHYQDHLQMKSCMSNSEDWKDNHRIISELKEDDRLGDAIKFVSKLEKREKFITKTTFRGTVMIGLGIVATQICNFFGIEVPFIKAMTFFK